jgi:hypothetical protein
MKPAHVELHIEELVLEGFAPGDHYRISEALQRELTRLFGAAGVSPTLAESVALEHLDGGAFQVAPGTRAETIGAQAARAIYGELSR